jgi:hypothetical protein
MILEHMWSYIVLLLILKSSVLHMIDNEFTPDLSEGSRSIQRANWTQAACDIRAVCKEHILLINED